METQINIGFNQLQTCSTFNTCKSILHIIYTAMKNTILEKSVINTTRTKQNHRSVILITNIKYLNFYVLILFIFVANLLQPVVTAKSSLRYNHNHKVVVRVLYQSGINSEENLPECDSWAVCNKVDTYSTPWIEKQCRCLGTKSCSTSLDHNDGHTVGDKSRQFKICEPINKLPICRYFRDITWTLTSNADNTTSQKVNCVCPKNSVAYIFKHQIFKTQMGIGYKYHFACSPETKLRCQRKEPCRLFTVRKRPDVEEVNTNTLCQCPPGYTCPTHHKESNVVTGTVYNLDHIRTYSGYCSQQAKRNEDNNYVRSFQSLR